MMGAARLPGEPDTIGRGPLHHETLATFVALGLGTGAHGRVDIALHSAKHS